MRYFYHAPWFLIITAFIQMALSCRANEDSDVYRVSPQGVDQLSIDGQSNPWQTLGYALSRLPEKGKALVTIEPGEYPPFVTTRRFKTPITIQARIPGTVTIGSAANHGPALFNGACNVIVEGLTFDNQNNPTPSNALQIMGGCSQIIIRGCTITHGSSGYANADAVKINHDVHDLLLEGNQIRNARDEIVEISDRAYSLTFRRNVIDQRTPTQKPLIYLHHRVWDITWEGNEIVAFTSTFPQPVIRVGNKLESEMEWRNIAFTNNIIIHPSDSGAVHLKNGEKITFQANLFFPLFPSQEEKFHCEISLDSSVQGLDTPDNYFLPQEKAFQSNKTDNSISSINQEERLKLSLHSLLDKIAFAIPDPSWKARFDLIHTNIRIPD